MGHNIFEFTHPCDHEEIRNSLLLTPGVWACVCVCLCVCVTIEDCQQQESVFRFGFTFCGCVFYGRSYRFEQVFPCITYIIAVFLRGRLVRCKEGLGPEDKKRSDTQRKKHQPQVSYVEGLWEPIPHKRVMTILITLAVVLGSPLPGPGKGVCRPVFSVLPVADLPASAPLTHTPQHTHLHQPAQHGHEVHVQWPEVIYTNVYPDTAYFNSDVFIYSAFVQLITIL